MEVRITGSYHAGFFSFVDLGDTQWEDITDWYIKWEEFHYKVKGNPDWQSIHMEAETEIDWKRPLDGSLTVYDDTDQVLHDDI